VLACLVEVLQQFLPGQFLSRLDHLGDPAVPDGDRPFLAALALELKTQLRPVNDHMVVLEGVRPPAGTFLRVQDILPTMNACASLPLRHAESKLDSPAF
jgi:hypothetical protein